MNSRRVLGVVALCALATAAVSFAVVDMSTSVAKVCTDETAACAHAAVPMVAVAFTVLGFLAIAVGLFPAIGWIIASLSHLRDGEEDEDEADRQAARALRPSTARFLDEEPSAATSRLAGDVADDAHSDAASRDTTVTDGRTPSPSRSPRRPRLKRPGRPPR